MANISPRVSATSQQHPGDVAAGPAADNATKPTQPTTEPTHTGNEGKPVNDTTLPPTGSTNGGANDAGGKPVKPDRHGDDTVGRDQTNDGDLATPVGQKKPGGEAVDQLQGAQGDQQGGGGNAGGGGNTGGAGGRSNGPQGNAWGYRRNHDGGGETWLSNGGRGDLGGGTYQNWFDRGNVSAPNPYNLNRDGRPDVQPTQQGPVTTDGRPPVSPVPGATNPVNGPADGQPLHHVVPQNTNPTGLPLVNGVVNAVNGLTSAVQAGVGQLLAPATTLAGQATTITAQGSVTQPFGGATAAQTATTTNTATAPQSPGATVRTAVPQQAPTPQQIAAAVADPRAQAAAAAAQSQSALTPSQAQAVNAAQRASAAQAQGQLAANQMALTNAAGRANSGNAQAVAMAQSALALTLGRAMAGQMTAGGAAMALAEGQLALRASRLAQAQALLQMPNAAQGQRGTAVAAGAQGRAAALAQGVGAAGAQVPSQGARGALPGQAAPTLSQTPRAGQLAQGTGKAGDAAQQAQAAGGAVMPRQLAATLAMAPKLRKRGSHDRVEKVDKFTPRSQQPEMEDEDFWDALGDEDQDHNADAAPDEAASAETAAEAAAQHYRAVHVWLQANDQAALLRELALGRRVLVLAPPDKTHLRLIGHMLWPDAADTPNTVHAAGARGRAWPLATRWSAMLPADLDWRQWRLRQWVDGEGQWHVAASQPDRNTPRVVLAGDEQANTPVTVGEYITVVEPRRLRRLMGRQWTMMVLRVPVPLDGMGAQSAVVGGR